MHSSVFCNYTHTEFPDLFRHQTQMMSGFCFETPLTLIERWVTTESTYQDAPSWGIPIHGSRASPAVRARDIPSVGLDILRRFRRICLRGETPSRIWPWRCCRNFYSDRLPSTYLAFWEENHLIFDEKP